MTAKSIPTYLKSTNRLLTKAFKSKKFVTIVKLKNGIGKNR